MALAKLPQHLHELGPEQAGEFVKAHQTLVQQLAEVKELLGTETYPLISEHQDIAASIIGHIRQAALGEALSPFEQRVASAMLGIYGLHTWTPVQRKWLERLAKQLAHEVIVDRDFVNRRFADTGGAWQLDKVLGQRLDEVITQVKAALWA